MCEKLKIDLTKVTAVEDDSLTMGQLINLEIEADDLRNGIKGNRNTVIGTNQKPRYANDKKSQK